jgi:hypothetical protein
MQRLAREQGATILLVTHDNRILDVADRIVHLEDGRLSSFSDSVLANNRHMMGLLARVREKEDLREHIDALDEGGVRALLDEITDEVDRFLEATRMATDRVFQSMLEQGLFAFTRKVAQLVDAERASLFLVDEEDGSLRLRVTQDLPVHEDIRIPLSSGVAGSVARTGEPQLVPDAYADPRFNPDIDRRFGTRTRSILALPLFARSGRLFAVAQVLNRRDGGPFDDDDLRRVAPFLQSIGVVLEGLETRAPLPEPAL